MYNVVFSAAAQADIDDLFAWIAERAGEDVAAAYIRRLRDHCLALQDFPQRGTKRDDVRTGLRTFGFERRVTIAFTVRGSDAVVLRILYGGRELRPATIFERT